MNSENCLKSFLLWAQVKDDERGILFKKGNFKKILKPGEHFLPHYFSYEVYIMNVANEFIVPEKDLNLFLKNEELLRELDVIEVKDGEIVLHYEDGIFKHCLITGKYAFWNVIKTHKFTRVDLRKPEIDENIDKAILSDPKLHGKSLRMEVEPHQKGVFFINDIYQRILEPGVYFYWNGPNSIAAKKVDMRRLQIDLTGQEILTIDKVSLRLNFVCHYKILEPLKVVMEVKNYEDQLHILLQLILREYIGSMKLDDLLRKKQDICDFVLENLKKKEAEFGINFIFVGIKDVILPGEIKDILNTVLIAEKKAQANIITRREETASTRSLLNTAKLINDNKTLYRLKEMEFIERICEKIGNISVSNGNSLLENLNSLIKSNHNQDGKKDSKKK